MRMLIRSDAKKCNTCILMLTCPDHEVWLRFCKHGEAGSLFEFGLWFIVQLVKIKPQIWPVLNAGACLMPELPFATDLERAV